MVFVRFVSLEIEDCAYLWFFEMGWDNGVNVEGGILGDVCDFKLPFNIIELSSWKM